MIKILKDKKGMAIELVISTAVMVFALCSIMVIYALQATDIGIFGSKRIDEKLMYDQIGEDYLTSLNTRNEFNKSNYYYTENKQQKMFVITFNELENTKTIIVSRSGITTFSASFELNNETNNYEIIRWVYGE